MKPNQFICTSIAAATIALSSYPTLPARANCNDRVGTADYYRPAMERLLQDLQQRQTYPWGPTQIYNRFEGNAIYLSAAFDRLAGAQKQQAIELLQLDYNDSLFESLTPAERQQPGIGAIPAFDVRTQDGRLVRAAYDGCTSVVLLTERDRYSYYTTRRPFVELPNGERRRATESELRNAGNPAWRHVGEITISPEAEERLRQRFWQAMGYNRADVGWWIAWVPEQGRFEIVVPAAERSQLTKFWAVASDKKYRYLVLDTEGTFLLER